MIYQPWKINYLQHQLIFIQHVHKKKAGIHSMAKGFLPSFFWIYNSIEVRVGEILSISKNNELNKNSVDLINMQTYTIFNLFQR